MVTRRVGGLSDEDFRRIRASCWFPKNFRVFCDAELNLKPAERFAKMFWWKVLCILGVVLCAEAQSEFACPRDFVLLSNSCYHFSRGTATWHNAYFDCQDRDSELAVVRKKWQDKLLRTYLKSGEMGWVDRWIGGIYDWKRMAWIWGSSGKPLRYRGFAKRVRKNLSSGNHQWKCISMNPNFRYRWEPKTCAKELHYICETRPYSNLVTK